MLYLPTFGWFLGPMVNMPAPWSIWVQGIFQSCWITRWHIEQHGIAMIPFARSFLVHQALCCIASLGAASPPSNLEIWKFGSRAGARKIIPNRSKPRINSKYGWMILGFTTWCGMVVVRIQWGTDNRKCCGWWLHHVTEDPKILDILDEIWVKDPGLF